MHVVLSLMLLISGPPVTQSSLLIVSIHHLCIPQQPYLERGMSPQANLNEDGGITPFAATSPDQFSLMASRMCVGVHGLETEGMQQQ